MMEDAREHKFDKRLCAEFARTLNANSAYSAVVSIKATK